jgi:hypothetical protein
MSATREGFLVRGTMSLCLRRSVLTASTIFASSPSALVGAFASSIGGGTFILRNIWNSRWGIQCIYGAGYGTIPYAYTARFDTEAHSTYWTGRRDMAPDFLDHLGVSDQELQKLLTFERTVP